IENVQTSNSKVVKLNKKMKFLDFTNEKAKEAMEKFRKIASQVNENNHKILANNNAEEYKQKNEELMKLLYLLNEKVDILENEIKGIKIDNENLKKELEFKLDDYEQKIVKKIIDLKIPEKYVLPIKHYYFGFLSSINSTLITSAAI